MAKINKIELNLSQKIANPFKTTRKSTTNPLLKNPFSYTDFEGNTLPVTAFADVFEGTPKTNNKLKMIASSVVGSMTKLRNSITEPIVNFVKRVGAGISNAWDYAKNTNIEIAGLKNISENLNNLMNYDVGKGLSDSISGINKHITGTITNLGHDLECSWTNLIGKIHGNKINKDTTVAELKAMWENEIALASKEAA